MATARKIGRWTVLALLACVVVLVALRVGVGIYLSSSAGQAMVARKIEAIIGMPVEVRSLSLGLRSSSLSLTAFDPNGSARQAEVFSVDSASADLTLIDLICGRLTPTKVDLKNLSLNLRVDPNGKILTALPRTPQGTDGARSLPSVQLTGGRITIEQEGRPQFKVQELKLSLEPQDTGEIKIDGGANDPDWSEWRIAGNINRDAGTGSVSLSTDDGPLSLDRLSSIPFVPASIWSHVHPAGRAAAEFRFNQGSDHEIHFAVDIKPLAASLTLPDANTTLNKVTGLIRVTDSRLDLQGARAELAGGSADVDGGVDFDAKPLTVTFKVAATGLDLQQLPEDWGLPQDIAGDLRGRANLTLVFYHDGKIVPQGGGTGTIENAKIRGIPATIGIRLVSNGKRFHFENAEAAAPPAPAALPAPKAESHSSAMPDEPLTRRRSAAG